MDAHRLSIAAIVDQHAEEAAFLALLRDYAVRAPHYDLEELAELDQRIEAHLDGLAIAGQAGHDALLEQLDAHAQGEAFALAVLAMQAGDDALIGRMRACLAASPEARRGFAAALGWLDWDQARPGWSACWPRPSRCSAPLAWPPAACTGMTRGRRCCPPLATPTRRCWRAPRAPPASCVGAT